MGAQRVGGPVIRTVAVAVTGVALLTSCGRLQAKQHPFPEAVGQSSASPGPSATATPRGSASPIPTGSLPPDRLAELPADELLKRARKAAGSTPTVRVALRASGEGETVAYDMLVDLNTGDFQGSMSLGSAHAEIRRIDGDAWIKADKAFWVSSAKAPSSVAETLSKKYVHVSQSMAGWEKFVGIAEIANPTLPLNVFRPKEKLSVRTLAGQQVIPVVGRSGPNTAILSLALSQGLLPVRFEESDGAYMEWQYGVVVNVAKPPAGSTVEAPQGSGVHLPGA
ncbi:hypothetical protein ACPA54_03920 [Uniformispora flossi]|uniref:hypothetical protein n=1 Tax=Uniformispora flossi TaxID=3390723 RepID=UPI003C2B32D5